MTDPNHLLGFPGLTRRRKQIVRLHQLIGQLDTLREYETVQNGYLGPAGNSDPQQGTSGAAPTSNQPPIADPTDVLDGLNRLDQALNNAETALTAAAKIIETGAKTPTPQDFDLTNTTRPTDACEWHWAAFQTYEPAHTKTPTNVGGTLTTPAHICEPCDTRVRRTGKQPRRPDLDYHRDHGKWPNKPINPTKKKRRR